MRDWYCAPEGEQRGPFSEDVMVTMIQNGEVTDATFVWSVGMSNWLPVRETELAGFVPAPPPLPCSAATREGYHYSADQSLPNSIPETYELATRSSRLAARTLSEACSLSLTAVILMLLYDSSDIVSIMNDLISGGRLSELMLFSGAIILWFIETPLLWFYRADLGKLIMGLRIVDSSGEDAPFWRIFLLRRNYTLYLYIINFLTPAPLQTIVRHIITLFYLADTLLIMRGDRRMLHDLIAGTVIIKKPQNRQ